MTRHTDSPTRTGSSTREPETKTVTGQGAGADADADGDRHAHRSPAADAGSSAGRSAPADTEPHGASPHLLGRRRKTLPPITVSRDSTLKWTNTGDLFIVNDDDGKVAINSQGNSGDTFVPAGTTRST